MTKPPRLRMIDIADHCGVSKAAVVRALNRPVEHSELRPDTWHRIREVAQRLGYRADWRARALAGGRSHTIGLLYDGIYPPLHGFPGRITAEVARWLAGYSYDVLLIPTDRDGWRHKLEDRRCDAGLVISTMPHAVENSADLPIPIVGVNIATRLNIPRVDPDDERGAREATDYLISLGHRRVAYIRNPPQAGKHHPSIEHRERGYRRAMQVHLLEPQLYSSAEAELVFDQPNKRPTAVVAYNDGTAARIMQIAYRRGIPVPLQLSLIAFNDDPEGELLSPPLTTMVIPIQALGKAAADMLMRLLDGIVPEDPRSLVTETLRIRESTAPPA